MIKVENLTKKYGGKAAVDNLSFEVKPGQVTGFLGPNGSGKSTTMRLIVGLDRPNKGNILVNNSSITKFKRPMSEIGVLLDADYVHPTRKAKNHLLAIAVSNGYGKKRVKEVLELVGLSEVANKRVGKFSLGMKQRLGLAAVLIGNPKTIMLDEPANGLDPEGIRWIRDFLSFLAKEGRTVFASSHLLSEMALMADELVVIGQGRLIEQTTVEAIRSKATGGFISLRTPNIEQLTNVLESSSTSFTLDGDRFHIEASNSQELGHLAFTHGIEIHELYRVEPSLEDAFLQITSSTQEYSTTHFRPASAGEPKGAAS